MAKFVGFGECVIDFIPMGVADDGAMVYLTCPGGSVANVCVAVSRFGLTSAFIGQVGNDQFGHFLKRTLEGYQVDASGMTFSDACGTFLAFAHPQDNGDVSYSFSNAPGADKLMRYQDVRLDLVEAADIVHFASCAMSQGETQETGKRLLKHVRDLGKIISYDVNYRASQYSSIAQARHVACLPIGYADVIKATEEELELITGQRGEAGVSQLIASGARIVLITRGREGSSWHVKGSSGTVKATPVDAVDAIGAGDCYFAAFLSQLFAEPDMRHCTADKVCSAAMFASRAAALSVTRRGAMAGMPTRREVVDWTS